MIRIGSRGSALALAQANWVADRLRGVGAQAEITIIRTIGDDRAQDTTWGEGAFVRAIEAALRDGRIDLAVHSAKDLPTDVDPQLMIAAWPVREDPRDALVCRIAATTLESLAHGARIGTDSPRRSAFLRAVRPDLRPHPLSGNVDTRLRKLDEGQTDALVLAVAGLSRLGRLDRISQVLPLDIAVPAPGQGALALQVRTADEGTLAVVARLDDPLTRVAVEAERAFLAATGGGCRSPIGALGEVDGETLTLHVAAERVLALPEGAQVSGGVLRWTERAPIEEARQLAESLAVRVVAARTRPRALVTRPVDTGSGLSDSLRRHGFEPLHVPTIAIEGGPTQTWQAAIVAAARQGSRIVATSPTGVAAALTALDAAGISADAVCWAVVGSASAAILAARGASALVPSRPTGAALTAELPLRPGEPILVVRGEVAGSASVDALRRRGAAANEVVAYRTIEGPAASLPLMAAALDGPVDVIVFASGSAVRGLLALAPAGVHALLRAVPVVAMGPPTAAVAREHGFSTVVEAEDTDADALTRAAARAVSLSARNDGRVAAESETAMTAAI